RQPPRHRSFWTAELPSDFLAGLLLQVAQDDDSTILVGKSAQLFVQQGLQVTPKAWFYCGWFRHVHYLPFPLLPSGGGRSRIQRRLVSHAIKPVSDHLPWLNGRCFANEDEEGGLERILSVMVAVEDTAADTPNHRAMPPHQGYKRPFVTAADVVLEQLPIVQPRRIPPKHSPANMLDDLARLASRHLLLFPPSAAPLSSTLTI